MTAADRIAASASGPIRAARRIDENLDADDVVVACPYCRWKSMIVRDDGEGICYVCGRVENITFCDRCHVAMVTGEEEEEQGKNYCRTCFEYVSSD
jgi:DNA-directed RNA polymerase subunit M/transcription elongation factor TFIIS